MLNAGGSESAFLKKFKFKFKFKPKYNLYSIGFVSGVGRTAGDGGCQVGTPVFQQYRRLP
jgi:hypothetical protein